MALRERCAKIRVESGVGGSLEFFQREQGMLGMPVMRYSGRVGSLQVRRSSDGSRTKFDLES